MNGAPYMYYSYSWRIVRAVILKFNFSINSNFRNVSLRISTWKLQWHVWKCSTKWLPVCDSKLVHQVVCYSETTWGNWDYTRELQIHKNLSPQNFLAIQVLHFLTHCNANSNHIFHWITNAVNYHTTSIHSLL